MNNDVYQVITDRIVGLLEKGVVPWQKPWQGGEQMPRNLISGHEYRGVNVFLLHAMSYTSPCWLTFNQARELGGHVKKGERACPVVFWKRLQVEALGEPGGKKIVPFLRYYSVFNVAQCEDIPADKIPVLSGSKREHCPIQAAESIVAAMPKKPEIKHGGGRACYLPSLDSVTMPLPETFRSGQDYYSVLFHELTHAKCSRKRRRANLYLLPSIAQNLLWSVTVAVSNERIKISPDLSNFNHLMPRNLHQSPRKVVAVPAQNFLKNVVYLLFANALHNFLEAKVEAETSVERKISQFGVPPIPTRPRFSGQRPG